MKDFVAENDCILEEWRNAYVNNNQSEYPDCKNLHEYFTPDGIMFKGMVNLFLDGNAIAVEKKILYGQMPQCVFYI